MSITHSTVVAVADDGTSPVGTDEWNASHSIAGTLAWDGATVTASAPLLDLSQTWNNSGVTFTGVKVNVTNTASAAASSLMDLQVGGNSVFQVSRTGGAIFSSPNAGAYPFRAEIVDVGGSTMGLRIYYSDVLYTSINSGGITFHQPLTENITWIGYPYLGRDAAQILAISASTSPTTLRVYNNRTDPSNYERGVFGWNDTANTLMIGTQAAGTGTNRDVKFVSASGVFTFVSPGSSVTPANNGDLVIQATSNTSLTFKYKGSDGTVRSASLTLA
jgi:hypothetical protein